MLKEILKYVAGLIVGAGLILVIGGGNSPSFAGYTTFSGINTTDGYQVDGITVIDGSGNLDVAGTLDVESLLSISGVSSTLQIGNDADGIGAGCIVLGDSGSATATPVYITATGATITGTTTKPAICQ